MHWALEISEANATLYISKNSESRKLGRSRYPNRAVNLIEQSPQKTISKTTSPIKSFWLRHWYHALARFGTTHLRNHYGINAHSTEPSQTKPARRKLLCWHGLVWLGFLYSSQAINTKAEMVKRGIIKNSTVHHRRSTTSVPLITQRVPTKSLCRYQQLLQVINHDYSKTMLIRQCLSS